MIFPTLNELNASRSMIDAFGGYNHNLRIGDGEFYDMKNLTSNYYPVLSPRGKRGVYASPSNPRGLISKDSLGYIDGQEFYLNKAHTNGLQLSTSAVLEKTTLISMGAYVIIITRDANGNVKNKKWVNSNDLTKFGDIEAKKETTAGTVVTFELCTVDGASYGDTKTQATAPVITEAMEAGTEAIPMWIDTSSTPYALKQYSTSTNAWSSVATTYIKISVPTTGFFDPFEAYDGVTLSGITDERLADLEGQTMVIQAKGDGYIVVIGIIGDSITQDTPFKVAREMPAMDFLIESENRLWGCRYGVANNGEVVNEIYASKLGDFKNWNCFQGISTDSYAATVGTDGQFTGAVTHLGYPLFFKENCMHKVYGNYPANYQIQTTACRGVQKGSERSLAIVNETLYYKSRSAVCAYDGSLPAEVSTALGETAYSNAVAGAHGNKYYISMQDSEGVSHLFVCDTAKGMWHKEDNTRVEAFCSCRGELYFIDGADRNKIKKMSKGDGEEGEDKVEWMAETGVIGTDSPDKKYISKLNVRMSLTVGTRVTFYIQYDSYGTWDFLFTMTGTSLRSFTVPIRPQRCDHFRLRIVGDGEARIFSIAKTIEEGSDV